jgi:hypothetical protein
LISATPGLVGILMFITTIRHIYNSDKMQYRWRALILSIGITGLGQAYFLKKYGAWVLYLLVLLVLSVVFAPLGFFIVIFSWVDAYLLGKAMDENKYYKSMLGELNNEASSKKEKRQFKCEKCGEINDWESKFCKECGAKVVD